MLFVAGGQNATLWFYLFNGHFQLVIPHQNMVMSELPDLAVHGSMAACGGVKTYLLHPHGKITVSTVYAHHVVSDRHRTLFHSSVQASTQQC